MPTLKPTANDIGYFDPTATAEGLVYNDVYEFKDRVETCVQLWSNKDVKDVILECLRGDALKWYSNELIENERKLLAFQDCDKWTKALITRFKIKTSRALSRVFHTIYLLSDARQGVLARQHANNILKLTRSAEITFIKDRVNYVYNSFYPDFKQNLKAPINSTIINEFLKQLNQHQET